LTKSWTNERKILVFTCAAHFFSHFYELLFPALAIPLMVYFQKDLPDILKLAFPMYLLYGLGALPWGIISDRFGNRRSLVIFFMGCGIGALMTAVSSSAGMVMISLGVIGFFNSIYHAAGMGMISMGIRNRGTALGINGAFGNLGMVSAPFTAGLLNWLVGWRLTYLVVGGICLLWGLFLRFVPIDERAVRADDNEPTPDRGKANNYGRYFLILCVIMTLSGLVYRGNSVVLPAYLEYRAGFLWDFLRQFPLENLAGAKTMAATFLASLIYLVGIVGQIMGGRLADRFDLRWLYFAFHALSLPFVLLMSRLTDLPLVAAAALYILFALGMQPAENSLVARFTPSRWRSTGYGIKFILVFGVGSLSVYLAGWLEEAWGLQSVYTAAAGVILFLLAWILFLIRASRGVSCRN